MQDKMRGYLENMFLWRELTALSHAACPHVRLEDMRVRPLDAAACASLAEEFELHALRRDMAALERLQWRDAGAPDTDAAGASSPSAAPATRKNVSNGEPRRPQRRRGGPSPGRWPADEFAGSAGRTRSAPWQPRRPPLPPAPGWTWPDLAGGPDKARPCGWHTIALAGLRAGDACSCTEVRWGGTAAALCAWLKDARRLVLADLKGLLVGEACWRALRRAKRRQLFRPGAGRLPH